MQIGIPRETFDGETRVSATPETVKKLVDDGHEVFIAENAGKLSNILNDDYVEAGAKICTQNESLEKPLILKVNAPTISEFKSIKSGSTLVGMLNPFDKKVLELLCESNVTAFSLEKAPRTTRAQTLDVLSSQANLAGYKAVIIAANEFPRLFPMLMTAAGTVKAAKIVIIGAGVAGLQAIATAKRLGAIVEASDVRPAVKEQVESLGARFIDVPFETDEEISAAKGEGGYAKSMPQSWLERQSREVGIRVSKADVVITTALIPGKKAPVLITREMIKKMRAGSVIIDLATEQGGNCEGSVTGEIILIENVKVVGLTNLPALVPTDASSLYARNIFDFLKLILNNEKNLHYPIEDEIVSSTLVVKEGKIWK
uniref:NAD(P) transhydrogenase subunit alpha part 1 n=1 Tax=uncultured beta proteobacterium HF0130_04F21 TaxID=710819 RepID=E0XSS2_9PROT|nr:NAD/NADP transhydrogenase alpha subunit [uncultured beta proteobacterium HF0130_04F21]